MSEVKALAVIVKGNKRYALLHEKGKYCSSGGCIANNKGCDVVLEGGSVTCAALAHTCGVDKDFRWKEVTMDE